LKLQIRSVFLRVLSPETHFQPLEIVILSEAKNLLFSGTRTKAAGPSLRSG
jgi:hypothetical protein